MSFGKQKTKSCNYFKFDLQRNKQHCKGTLYNQTLNVYFY